MNKIVVLDGYTLNPGDLDWKGFEALGDLTVYERTNKEDVVLRVGDASIVLTNKTPVDKEVLDACPNIKYIGVLATGYNIVDVNATKEKGIVVTNIPTYGTSAVAQYTFALLLELCHRVEIHSKSVFDGKWEKSSDFCYWLTPQTELSGKTIGIIGYGRIGKAVARIALALDMKVLVYNKGKETNETNVISVDLEELYSQSDVITLHCPLTDDNHRMINEESISKMKNGVLLINTARGGLVDEQALTDSLKSGKISGAAVDVVSREPIIGNNPLLTAPNCIITPHIAWASLDARKRLMEIAVNNLSAFLAGKPINKV